MKIIITGASGMVGKAILLECLEDRRITEVLCINRKPLAVDHPKYAELILNDFSNIAAHKSLFKEYHACYYSMGVSVVGLKEKEYTKLTYNYAKTFADTMYLTNPNMLFNYVSGSGTDSSEKGKTMWARVKGKTENYILNKGFKDAYMFRPGAIIPEKGIKSRTGWYNAIYVLMSPFFPLFKLSSNVTTTTKLGKAMVNTAFNTSELKHLENKNINHLAKG